ncbi:hypothetical protein CANARDRAFT_29299 [[Candida] arabinofermentans NRRL YB-2248]|uniref:Replication termination factor 2 n=1 Tax=[Candida] arabinofermentans NRRL YB-2248 TaxID=983967 RepID=A0A1E4SXA9_9ASCO|nr:hypothetical protein CANARDRAFT_29299 [[Candida] arabinofermentans NRRL YB-2248]
MDERKSIQVESFKKCHLSGVFLKGRICSDYLGNLYDFEKILEYLISLKNGKGGTGGGDSGGYSGDVDDLGKLEWIKSMKDIVELKPFLKFNDDDDDCSVGTCQIIDKLTDSVYDIDDFSNNLKFCYLVPCGCVMGLNTLSELIKIQEKSKNSGVGSGTFFNMDCPLCGVVFSTRDIININSIDLNILRDLNKRLEGLKDVGLSHSLKKITKKSDKKKSEKKRKIVDVNDDLKINKKVRSL